MSWQSSEPQGQVLLALVDKFSHQFYDWLLMWFVPA
jgi:hypothetical protein